MVSSVSINSLQPASDINTVFNSNFSPRLIANNSFGIKTNFQPGTIIASCGTADSYDWLRSGSQISHPNQMGGARRVMALGLDEGPQSDAEAAALTQAICAALEIPVIVVRTYNIGAAPADRAGIAPTGSGNGALFRQYDFYTRPGDMAKVREYMNEVQGRQLQQSVDRSSGVVSAITSAAAAVGLDALLQRLMQANPFRLLQ